MIAMPPEEIEEAINKVNEAIAKETNIDKTIAAYAKLGIQVKNPDGSFKCWYDILNEVSEVWDKLNIAECNELFKNINEM